MDKFFCAFSLCDERMSEECRRAIALGIARSNPCCLPPLSRGLVSLVRRNLAAPTPDATTVSPNDIAEKLLQLATVLYLASYFIRLSVACIEHLHKMHRDLISADGCSVFYMMCATSVCTTQRATAALAHTRRYGTREAGSVPLSWSHWTRPTAPAAG